jgi:hypothetical protein
MYSNILDNSLSKMNFKLYKSKPFGNCFFNSVAKYFRLINNSKGSSKDIRLNLIKYITNNDYIMLYIQNTLGMTEKQTHDDLYELRNIGVYDLDIFDIIPIIIANQYNIKVSIYTWMECSEKEIDSNDKETYYPIKYDKNIKEMSLLYSNMEHYDLLFPC